MVVLGHFEVVGTSLDATENMGTPGSSEDRLVCNVTALSGCVTFGMECPSFGRPCFLFATIAAGRS